MMELMLWVILVLVMVSAALNMAMYSRMVRKSMELRADDEVQKALDAALLEKFDCIIALNNGTLVESGDFETLMRRKGYFYALYTVSQ